MVVGSWKLALSIDDLQVVGYPVAPVLHSEIGVLKEIQAQKQDDYIETFLVNNFGEDPEDFQQDDQQIDGEDDLNPDEFLVAVNSDGSTDSTDNPGRQQG